MRWMPSDTPPQPHWVQHFALFPVLLEDTGEYAWLEYVWRHTDFYSGGMGDTVADDHFRSAPSAAPAPKSP